MQSHRTLRKHNIPATRNFTGNVGRPVGSVAPRLQGEKVTILDKGYDWDWYPAEMQQFREMWEAGISLPDIAVRLKRPQKDVALLWLNEAFEGRIREREGGLLGETHSNV